MPRTVKVFLPRWIRWLILPVLLLIWGVITYATFVEAGPERMGFVPWLAVTVILIVIGVMLWLMTAGRLPVYVVHINDDDDPAPSS